jgi:transposase
MDKQQEIKLSKPRIIDTYDKKMGYWYVHSNQSYWDKEKQQTRHIRRTIGKRLTKDGPIIYNNRFKAEQLQKDGLAGIEISSTASLGESLVLDSIVSELGLRRHLVKAFGKEDGQTIISLAQYTICTKGALSWAGDWSESRDGRIAHLDSQKISDFLQTLHRGRRDTFYASWMQANQEKGGYFCFDSTNISAHDTETNALVEFGHSHGHIKLPQTNLAILANQSRQIPMHQLLYQGSRHDSTSIRDLVSQLDKLELKNICLTLDKGYYSEKNLQLLHGKGYDYIICVPRRVEMQYPLIDTVRDELLSLSARTEVIDDRGEARYVQCVSKHFPVAGRRQYLVVIYDADARAEAERTFIELLATCKAELESGKLVEGHEEIYEQYFEVKQTPKRGRRVTEKIEAVADFQKKYSGYWCLLTNRKRPKEEILNAYSQRNTIEVFYDTLKHELNGNRVRNHSLASFEGRLFILFIALTILITLKQRLAEERKCNKELRRLKTYTQLLFRMETLTRTTFKGKYKPIYSTPSKIQREVIKSFGLSWPLN